MTNQFEALIAVLKRALPLKELPRVGWIMEGATLSEADSIGAHSYIVVLTSLLLTRQLEKSFGPFDREKVLTMATLHDLAECITGDIDSGLKRRIAAKVNQRGIIEQIEQEALSALVADISDSDSLLKTLREFDEGKTKEAKLVKFADILEAFAFGHDRMGKVYDTYLSHAKDQLIAGSPSDDAGLGIHLASLIDLAVLRWNDIAPKELD